MFEDEDQLCGVGFSFEALEREEAAKLSKSLEDIYRRLHSEIPEPELPKPLPIQIESTRNYYSEGYEANYDGVDDKEIRQWQQNFGFLCATGKFLKTPIKDSAETVCEAPHRLQTASTDSNYFESFDLAPPLLDCNSGELTIIGKSLSIGRLPQGCEVALGDEREEEVIACHGTLQEYIAHNMEGPGCLSLSETETCKPEESLKEEVVSSMLDAIWPDLVVAMKPLIQKVLETAAGHNIPYVVDQSSVAEVKEQADCWAMDGSDDGGGW